MQNSEIVLGATLAQAEALTDSVRLAFSHSNTGTDTGTITHRATRTLRHRDSHSPTLTHARHWHSHSLPQALSHRHSPTLALSHWHSAQPVNLSLPLSAVWVSAAGGHIGCRLEHLQKLTAMSAFIGCAQYAWFKAWPEWVSCFQMSISSAARMRWECVKERVREEENAVVCVCVANEMRVKSRA